MLERYQRFYEDEELAPFINLPVDPNKPAPKKEPPVDEKPNKPPEDKHIKVNLKVKPSKDGSWSSDRIKVG